MALLMILVQGDRPGISSVDGHVGRFIVEMASLKAVVSPDNVSS